MSDVPPIGEIEAPQFCPWCGSPATYRPDEHIPLWKEAADEKGIEAPAVVREALHTDAYVVGCPGCKRLSHVIGHHTER